MAGNVHVTGIDLLQRILQRAVAETGPALAKALHAEALEAFAASQREVPRRTGVLANSGVVMPPVVTGSTVEQDIGYGGAASAYALIVHEDLSANHPRGGKAKYLEDPVNARLAGMDGRLIASIARVLRIS